MRLTHINSLCEGAEIARTILRADGSPFIEAGEVVDADLMRTLREARISRVYTADPLTDDVPVCDILSPETRAEACACVCDAFAGRASPLAVRRAALAIVREVRASPEMVHGAAPIYRVEEHVMAHGVESALIAVLIAEECGMAEAQSVSLAQGMLLHDIGAQAQTGLLLESGELTAAERELTRGHARIGFEALRELLGRSPIGRSIALLHHERLDGSGYPRGLQGGELTPVVRVAALADVYTALISDRPHRAAGLPDEAISYFLRGGASQFDQDLVRCLARRVEVYLPGTWARIRDGRCGIVLGSRIGATVRPRIRLLEDEQRRRLPAPLDLDLAARSEIHIADVFYD